MEPLGTWFWVFFVAAGPRPVVSLRGVGNPDLVLTLAGGTLRQFPSLNSSPRSQEPLIWQSRAGAGELAQAPLAGDSGRLPERGCACARVPAHHCHPGGSPRGERPCNCCGGRPAGPTCLARLLDDAAQAPQRPGGFRRSLAGPGVACLPGGRRGRRRLRGRRQGQARRPEPVRRDGRLVGHCRRRRGRDPLRGLVLPAPLGGRRGFLLADGAESSILSRLPVEHRSVKILRRGWREGGFLFAALLAAGAGAHGRQLAVLDRRRRSRRAAAPTPPAAPPGSPRPCPGPAAAPQTAAAAATGPPGAAAARRGPQVAHRVRSTSKKEGSRRGQRLRGNGLGGRPCGPRRHGEDDVGAQGLCEATCAHRRHEVRECLRSADRGPKVRRREGRPIRVSLGHLQQVGADRPEGRQQPPEGAARPRARRQPRGRPKLPQARQRKAASFQKLAPAPNPREGGLSEPAREARSGRESRPSAGTSWKPRWAFFWRSKGSAARATGTPRGGRRTPPAGGSVCPGAGAGASHGSRGPRWHWSPCPPRPRTGRASAPRDDGRRGSLGFKLAGAGFCRESLRAKSRGLRFTNCTPGPRSGRGRPLAALAESASGRRLGRSA
jgi:hypothetical protein